MNFFEKLLLSSPKKVYDSGYKNNQTINVPSKPLPKSQWRQSDIQAEAMQRAYKNTKNYGGKGWGP